MPHSKPWTSDVSPNDEDDSGPDKRGSKFDLDNIDWSIPELKA